MGCLWTRDCDYCRHLFEALTMGVCRVTDHTVEYVGDGEFAKECPHYENRWGYEEKKQVTNTKKLPQRPRFDQSMLDLQMIDKGEPYKKLKQSYIIFICPFDTFGGGRHIYSFANICKEDHKILLGDETTKISLNADSCMDDVSEELKAFLDYVAGRKSEDGYVKRLETAIKEAKKNREWRHEYMTLLMRDQENIEKGIEKGIEALVSTLREFGIQDDVIIQKIQEKFNIPEEEAKKYIK